jgi:hypothetical protein
MSIVMLCIYVAIVSWILSKHYHARVWGEDILERVERKCGSLYVRSNGELLHEDQEMTPKFRPLAPSLTEMIQAQHRRSVWNLREPAIRWRVPSSRFVQIDFTGGRQPRSR